MEPKYYIECFSKKVETEIEGFSYCAALEPIEVPEAVYDAFQDERDEVLEHRRSVTLHKKIAYMAVGFSIIEFYLLVRMAIIL
jgi:hypothetical protein